MSIIDPYEVAALRARRYADAQTIALFPWYPIRSLTHFDMAESRRDMLRIKGQQGEWITIPRNVLAEMAWDSRDLTYFTPRAHERDHHILLRLAREINWAAERVAKR